MQNELLLGTDLQPRLGLTLSMKKGGGRVVGLLSGGRDVSTTTDMARKEDGTDYNDRCKERDWETALVMDESHLLSQLGVVDRAELVTTSKDEEMTTREEPDCVQEIEEVSASVQRLESDVADKKKRKAHLSLLGRLPPTAQQELVTLLASYSDVFTLDSIELGTTDVVTHSIETGDHRPTRQPVRRTPFTLREKVDTLVREMLEQKVIEPSESPWASSIVLIRKKNGGVRFCMDYRKLNEAWTIESFNWMTFSSLGNHWRNTM